MRCVFLAGDIGTLGAACNMRYSGLEVGRCMRKTGLGDTDSPNTRVGMGAVVSREQHANTTNQMFRGLLVELRTPVRLMES